MQRNDRDRLSRSRQSLTRLAQEILALLPAFLQRGPVVKGTVYEHDQSFVVDSFREGDFDYADAVDEVTETQFFRYLGAHKILPKLVESHPDRREKKEVPTWINIADNLSMRIYGVHSFHANPYAVRCGGMLNAFGPEVGHKTVHPKTRDVTLSCAGFNDKNTRDRSLQNGTRDRRAHSGTQGHGRLRGCPGIDAGPPDAL